MDDTTTNEITTKKACPVGAFLAILGEALLTEKRRAWMDMNEVADFCEAQGILLDGKCSAPDELELALREFFLLAGEFYAFGLAVDGYERRVGWDRVFMIRAYPHTSAQHLASAGSVGVQDPVCAGPETEVAKVGYKVSISSPSNSQSL